MKKVLIIKLRYIGDTLTLLPLVRALKQMEPEVQVSVMVYKGTEGILAHQKEIDEMITIDRKEIKAQNIFRNARNNLRILGQVYRKKFDWVIDLTSSDRTALISWASRAQIRTGVPLGNFFEKIAYHDVIGENPKTTHIVDYQMASLKSLKKPIPEPHSEIAIPEEIENKIIRQWGYLLKYSPVVIIHPGARRRLRCWREERFAELADRIKKNYSAQIVLIGGAGEEEILQRVQEKMRLPPEEQIVSLPLIEVAALLKQAQLFIGNDTATGHIAAGVGTPHIILFGPNSPKLWAPRGGKGVSLFKAPPCCGCAQISCIHEGNPCMDWIQVEEVWNAVRTLI
jgi:ADP-heptose:LPS heptosyltransferase